MAKKKKTKKGKTDEPKAKVSKSKKTISKRKRSGTKSSGRNSKAKKTGTKSAGKKSAPAKKSIGRKIVSSKKTSPTQKGVRKSSKVPSTRKRTPTKNTKTQTGAKKGKRTSKPFKLGKRVSKANRSAEWNYIARASNKIPKRARYIRKVLTGSKDKSRGSEFFGKQFRIKKTIQVYKPKPLDDSTFKFLVKRNIRALKIDGKSERKAYLKAMYIDATGTIRWTSVSREVLKTAQDVEDKVRLLFLNLKNYGDVKFLGIETEEVEDEWDADEDLGDFEV